MEKSIKELKGFSGSKIYLMEENEKYFVRKIENINRNLERLKVLEHIIKVPEILREGDNFYDMEYIHGLDMNTFLLTENHNNLINYIEKTMNIFKKQTLMENKNYLKTYEKNLKILEQNNIFPFTKKELIDSLPECLPQTTYHGDFTLENIIHSNKNIFYAIDPVYIDYDSYVFDLAKMQQDTECKWFLRNNSYKHNIKLNEINQSIYKLYPDFIKNKKSIIILMLLRVFRHTQKDSFEYNFIVKEIKRLWS